MSKNHFWSFRILVFILLETSEFPGHAKLDHIILEQSPISGTCCVISSAANNPSLNSVGDIFSR